MKEQKYKYENEEDWLDDFILVIIDVIAKYKRQQYFTQGRLFIEDTFEYQFSTLDIDDKIDVLYDSGWKIYKNATHKFKGWLTYHEVQSIILESIWEVLQVHELKSYDEYIYIILSYIQNKCCNLVDYKKANKRGGDISHTSLNKDEPIIIPIHDNKYNKIETSIWLHQITNNLTNNEQKYLSLIIEEPHILEMSNVEIANELGVTRQGLYNIKNSLKSKIDIEQLKH